MRSGLWYTGVSLLVALTVGWAGGSLLTGDGRRGVWLGAGLALAAQVPAFWLLFVALLRQRPGLAHGLGVLARFLLVAVVALVIVPRSGVPAGPTLFSLVAVLFLTTLAEPVVLQIATKTRR